MNKLGNTYNWAELSDAERRSVLQRPAVAANAETVASVRAILADVQSGGDAALRELGWLIEGIMPTNYHVMIRFGKWEDILREPLPAEPMLADSTLFSDQVNTSAKRNLGFIQARLR